MAYPNYGNKDNCVYIVVIGQSSDLVYVGDGKFVANPEMGKLVRRTMGYDLMVHYPDGRLNAKHQRIEIKKWADRALKNYKDKTLRIVGFIPKWVDPAYFIDFYGVPQNLKEFLAKENA